MQEGKAGPEEKAEWKKAAMAFLTAAYEVDKESAAIRAMPHKLNRLSSFYLAHSCDRQLQAIGFSGYAHFFERQGDEAVIEERPFWSNTRTATR